jgi:hypothetical protein
VGFQANLCHPDSKLPDRGWRIGLVHQVPLREHTANMGKAIILVGIFGFGDVDEVKKAAHCQHDPQRMRECNVASVREIGWMDNRLNPLRHDILWLNQH